MEKVDSSLVLAIAISIVRHKPAEQSMSSYILDLRDKFPLSRVASSVDSDSGRLDNESEWRTRALAFEKENELLKLRLQKYELELLAIKSSSQIDNSSSAQAPKKKRKVESKAASNNPNILRELVAELASGSGLPLLHDSFDIISSFLTLKSTNTNDISVELSRFNMETILTPNVKRSLKALGKLLHALLRNNPATPIITCSERIHVADRFRELLLALLHLTLPLTPRCTLLSHFMEELCLGIIRPIILGFHTTSTRMFKPLENKSKNAEVDIRPSMLRVIQQLLDCLRGLKEDTREIREFLVVETAREIASLWGKTTETGTVGELEGIQRLARKDSLWYHCAVINIALEDLPQKPVGNDELLSVLSTTAADLLYDLPRLFEQEYPVDSTAQGMILAIIEKAWLKGLCICHVEEGDLAENSSEQTEEHSTAQESSS